MYSVCDLILYLLNERAYTVTRAVYIDAFMYRTRELLSLQHACVYGVLRRETG